MCVTDVGVAVTNLRVVCKIITCVSAFTEMVITKSFLKIVKAAADRDTPGSGYSLHEGCHCERLPLY